VKRGLVGVKSKTRTGGAEGLKATPDAPRSRADQPIFPGGKRDLSQFVARVMNELEQRFTSESNPAETSEMPPEPSRPTEAIAPPKADGGAAIPRKAIEALKDMFNEDKG
jgi:hypothetical protein